MSARTSPREAIQPPSTKPHAADDHSIRPGAWMALLAALLGWMFDGFEMGLFPLVARPALIDLLGASNTDLVGLWFGVMIAVFLVGAATGGVLFGWLGDRIGRVRAMTLSVLTYTIFMGLCGLSGSRWLSNLTLPGWSGIEWSGLEQMLVFRFLSSLGMGGEWSLGVALVMEIWPNRSRAFLAGLIGAAANVGFLLIAVIGLGLGMVIGSMQGWLLGLGLPQNWVNFLVTDSTGAPSGWRLMMLFGALPALLTFFIRLFVPESERWLHAKEQGGTSAWATRDLVGVGIGALGPLGMVYLWANDFSMPIRFLGSALGLTVALVGYTYPVIRYLQRSRTATDDTAHTLGPTMRRMLLGACLSAVALLGTWGSLQWAPAWADQLVDRKMQGENAPPQARAEARSEARAFTQILSGIGAIIGTIAGAMFCNAIGRRWTYSLLCLTSLISILAFYLGNTSFGWMFLVSVFFAGGITAAFYGWLPLYLPELFSTRVRATGQGFSFNFGRILAAVGALQTGYLMKEIFNENYPQACSVMSLVYIVGIGIIWLAPETKGKPLPD